MLSLFIIRSLCDDYEVNTFDQVIDHNNPGKTFIQRYFVNTDYAKKTDYLIFYLGGFATLNIKELENSPVNFIASSTKAIVIGLENRYFGASIPTEDLSTENLKYNTVDQHLEDIKDFIIEMKKEYCNDPSTCRVLTVGRGFGASLATWIHMKKGKELNIVGTWASSAFLLADTEFSGYDHHEAVVINRWGDCYNTFGNAYGTIDMIANRKDNTTTPAMEKRFGVSNTTGLKDRPIDFVVMFTEAISTSLRTTTLTQYMETMCRLLNSNNYTTEQKIVDLFAEYVPKIVPTDKFINLWPHMANDTNLNSQLADKRAEYYIKCNEISSFPCAGKNAELRDGDINPEYWTSVCTDLFNITKLANATIFNNKYGGRFPHAERTYFTHGFNDAFLEASCTEEDLNIDKRVAAIIDSGFSDDLNTEQDTDSPQLRKIRQKVIDTMINWLQYDHTPGPSLRPTESPSPSITPSPKPTETISPNPTQTVVPQTPTPDSQNTGEIPVIAKATIGVLAGALVILIIITIFLVVKLKKSNTPLISTVASMPQVSQEPLI